MPPLLKALSPRPLASPAVVPASPKRRGGTDVARPVAGNAAMTAAMSGLPRGAGPVGLLASTIRRAAVSEPDPAAERARLMAEANRLRAQADRHDEAGRVKKALPLWRRSRKSSAGTRNCCRR